MKKRIGIIIFCSIILISNIVLAKYQKQTNGSYKGKFAEPIINIQGEITSENVEISSRKILEFTLIVSNYNENKINDVAQNYYVEMFSNEFTLTGFDVTIMRNGVNVSFDNMKTQTFSLSANTEQIDIFVVRILYSGKSRNVKGSVNLRVVAEQAEPKIS